MLCKNLKLKLIAIFSILLSCFNLMADDVTFTTNAPETVEVGEQFRVQFMLNVDGGDFFEINIADFKIISGPTKSSSNNIQWVNGQMLKKTTSTFSLILMAEYEGKNTIP